MNKLRSTKMKKLLLCILFVLPLAIAVCQAQKTSYDLSKLFAGHKLGVLSGDTIKILNDGQYNGVTCSGIAWITDASFTTGTIDVDFRGRDVVQQSFIGIAFHGADNKTSECVYFRPFNFQTNDTLRGKHMVQYMNEPTYPWDRLRKENPLVYENTIEHAPDPKNWLHAHIVVTADQVTVFVNHSTKPSLKVTRLNKSNSGRIGLWDNGYAGDFANLVIVNDH